MKQVVCILDNKLRIKNGQIDKETLSEIKKELSYSNSKYHKLEAMRKNTRGIPKIVRSYSLEKGHMAFSRGAVKKIREILAEKGYTLKIEDKRVLRPYEGFKSNINLRKYQKTCVKQAMHFQNDLIQGGCGSGKTIILLEVAVRLKQKTLIVVPTEVLFNQWIERIEFFLGIPKKEIGMWGSGKKIIKPITVGIINSVNKDSKKLSEEFGAVLVDEVHRSPASMFQDFLDESKAFYRIGATATPYRKDNLQCLMFDQFGQIVYEIKKDVLKRDKILMDVEFIVVATDFVDQEYNFSKSNDDEEDEASYNSLLQNMIEDEGRNELIFKYVKEGYDENHTSIILSDRLQFCSDWQEKLNKLGMDSHLLIGGKTNQKERDKAIGMLSNRTTRIGIGTSVADEGLDIPVLDRGYITTPTATNRRRIEQQVGRMERRAEGKTDAKVYYFWDYKIKGIDNHIQKLAKMFPEAKVMMGGKEFSILEIKKKQSKGEL